MGRPRWVQELVRRLERAEEALSEGDVTVAFDAYGLVYRTLAAQWPEGVSREDALDGWFDGLVDPGLEAPPLSESLSDLLWMRVQLEDDDEERRRQLVTIAEELAERFVEGQPLRREAELTAVVVELTAGAESALPRADSLCKRFPDDAWIRLELSRACGRLRPPERRNLELVSKFAHQALSLGSGETDLYVYEDLATLLGDAGDPGELEAFERAFWTPERIGIALRTYGPEPPLGAVEAAVRFGDLVVPTLVGVLDDEDVWHSAMGSGDPEEDAGGYWAAVHALRIAAELGASGCVGAAARWLRCPVRDVREVMPLVAHRIGEPVVSRFAGVLHDRGAGLEGRRGAAIALTGAALGDRDAREPAIRALRRTLLDETAPSTLRTECALRLAMLKDEASRADIERGLKEDAFDTFLFDETDVETFFESEGFSAQRELGLEEEPLAPYRQSAERIPTGVDDIEVDALTQLLETLSEPLSSPGQSERAGHGGAISVLDRARLRLAERAMEELGLSAWHDALMLYLGAEGRSARDCIRMNLEWPFADFLTLDVVDRKGCSVATRMLASPPLMSADEREALAGLAASQVLLLEAMESAPADAPGVLCRRVPHGEPLRVKLPAGLAAVRWDLLLGRLVQLEGGESVLLYANRLRRDELRRVVTSMDAGERSLRALVPGAAPEATPVRVASAIQLAQSVRIVMQSSPPSLRDAAGSDIIFCEAVYDIENRAGMLAALEQIERFERASDGGDEDGDIAFRWLAPPDSDPLVPAARRLHGEVFVRNGRLVLACHTQQRLAEGRRLVEVAAGASISHRADSFADPTSSVSRMREQPDAARDALRSEEARALIGELLRRHYERWVDIPIPALGDRSPRVAVGDEQGRRDVEELLRIIENVEGHRARNHGFGYDTDWLRGELGLG